MLYPSYRTYKKESSPCVADSSVEAGHSAAMLLCSSKRFGAAGVDWEGLQVSKSAKANAAAISSSRVEKKYLTRC